MAAVQKHAIHVKHVFKPYMINMGYEYCSASGMFVENRTDGFDAHVQKLVYGFDAHVQKLVYGFRERLDISETVINSSAWRSSKLLQLWEDYLYWP